MNKLDMFGSTSSNNEVDKKNHINEKDHLKNGERMKKDKQTLAFGIDLGTTNSAICVIANGNKTTPIELDNGKVTMPSCVLWNGSKGGFIVGEEAYQRVSEVDHCVHSIKRHMEDSTYRHTFKHKGETLTMTPAEISAEILKALTKKTNGVYGEIKDVVVTVPAYFKTTGRQATVEACKLAGLNLLGLLVEPSSAALTYNLKANEEGKNIVVYDLGGGTFDISLIHLSAQKTKIEDSFIDIYDFDDNDEDINSDEDSIKDVETHYSVLDVSGDSKLGGDDCDKEMYKIVERKIAATGINVKYLSDSYKASMIHRLEYYKKNDINSSYSIEINTTLTDRNKTIVRERIEINSKDFERSMMPTYKKTVKLLKELINRNYLSHNVNEIILVGGSTKSEIIRKNLKKDFPDFNINYRGEPDLSVALGASISAKVLKFGDKSVKIFDVLPMAICIKEDNKLSTIIPRAASLPATATRYFSTVVDNQEKISVEIYQGNSHIPEESTFLGNIYIDGIEPKPAGKDDICVTALIDVNGVLHCTTTIGNITKDVTLELNGKAPTKKLSMDEKRIIRYKNIAEGLKIPEHRNEALRLIKAYPKFTNINEIMKYITYAQDIENWSEEIKKLKSDINKSIVRKLISKYPEEVNRDTIVVKINQLLKSETDAEF